MKKYLIIAFLSIGSITYAQNWFVSGEGNDSNDGKTVKTAFRTLQKAADLVVPGDLVSVDDGNYTSTDNSGGSSVLNITKSGMPDAWITFKAADGAKPEVNPFGWSGIQISGSYIIVDGINVIGNNDSIYLLQAQEDAKKAKPNPYFNTNGIFINGRNNTADNKPHHIVIRNCNVGKCGGGGITGIETDYLTIEDCKVFNNAWFMRYGGSGITLLNNWAFDDKPGYHVIIQRNYVWNNKTMVPWDRIQKLSDGNGILLDVTDTKKSGATNPNADDVASKLSEDSVLKDSLSAAPMKPQRPEWKGRSLIANNLSAFNGGSGIHTFRTKHVDIFNNTTYHNGLMVGYQELFPNNSEDIVIMNNIMVPRPGGVVTSNNKNTDIKWDYNLYSVEQEVFKGAHDIVADPDFINAQLNVIEGNFQLKKGSPGLNSGLNDITTLQDLNGKKRPKGKGVDRGAFEQ